ncbi:efflux RND transporter periplasmic adaptor subunit [Hansschlegelia zhihuaiae]|uniref:Efflux RND transporter periplasmic adaptor subunit n=1 Tax=Hansschlegelia zhihuaiae TaxID=405005 RepID=A0A4Q0MNG3_9HYPH|nr:efflux RND transporter periplasmic adaptor subunit [Hansschlegelia zhihuaiae]RXF75173.1 efflux RND transporter periplasmic adaptor subunit [Hansschlegelia zhihuaiae]
MRAIDALAGLLTAALALNGGIGSARGQTSAPATPSVGTVAAERKPISKSLDFVGRIEGVEKVEVRARVVGFLEDVLFKEGDVVEPGAPLYKIEQAQYQAEVQKAEGAIDISQAANALAIIQLQRAEDLVAKNAGTVVARDQARAQKQQTEGSILSDEANLKTAQTNLGYTDIKSPIRGRIGRTAVTKGNVVGPDSGVLTTIVSQDPMYVVFPVSQREFLKSAQAGKRPDPKSIKVRLRFADDSLYDQLGQIDFVDVSVDRGTDTLLVRARIPNPAGALTDGQFVRVALEAGQPQEKVVVPQAALIADQAGVYVFAVEDGKAVTKRVKLGGDAGVDAIVEEGLSGGEQIIVEGLQTVRQGAPVRASPARASAKGM